MSEKLEKWDPVTVTLTFPREIHDMFQHLAAYGDGEDWMSFDEEHWMRFGVEKETAESNLLVSLVLQRLLDAGGMEYFKEGGGDIDPSDYNMEIVNGKIRMKTLVQFLPPNFYDLEP